jgi:HTH-type transcriptional regulator / antitoxin HigA
MNATTTAMDYAELLKETLPRVIHSDAQNAAFAARLEEIVFKETLSPAEEELVELLTLLIEEYEKRRFPVEAATPTEVLGELITAHSLKQKDLADIFGAESTVSAVLNGKRPLTRDHIEKLSQRFNVSPAVFF